MPPEFPILQDLTIGRPLETLSFILNDLCPFELAVKGFRIRYF